MSNVNYLIVIGGPTASGKTGMAIHLANYFNTEILSADSRQFYKEMNIGTAKPTQEELSAAPHHFINTKSIKEDYSVGDFEIEAIQKLEELFETKNIAVLAGGSGLFIKAVCEGLDEFPDVDPSIRSRLNELYEREGISGLQEKLRLVDPVYYKVVDLNNPKRIIRALEVYEECGKPYSSFRSNKKKERNFTPIYIQMHWDRAELYDRINLRVDMMIEEGLQKEVESLLEFKDLNSLQTVGYQEFFPYFKGEYDLERVIFLIKRNSRRYAKRQLTWMRKNGTWKQFHPSEKTQIIKYIKGVIENEGTQNTN